MEKVKSLFFKQAFVFAVVLVLLTVMTDRLCFHLLEANYDFKPSYVTNAKPSAEVVILGSSRVIHMMDPRAIERKTGLKAYNLGINAGNTDEQAALLRLYLQHNPRPKVIVVEFTPEHLSQDQLYFHPYLFANHLFDPGMAEMLKRYEPRLLFLRYLPLVKYGFYNEILLKRIVQGAWHLLRGKRESASVQGYEAVNPRWDGTYDAYVLAHPQGEPVVVDDERLASLEALILLAKASADSVVFYEAPILAESLVLSQNRETVLKRLSAVFEKAGVPYRSFQNLPLGQSRKWFYNSRHLNRVGTDMFSEIFAEYLKGFIDAKQQLSTIHS
jgi:hypothetical protein